jgi:hypothetical protein
MSDAPDNILHLPMCKCQRAPRRNGQRNCLHCNREANKKFRESLRRQKQALAQILSQTGRG